ncbi:DegT/DnrJ/EryC1/StrS aminotransferase family protein [Ahrensia sp. R2A130]|uniref:DegT/DnrJ/EryC1/StrS family aminotransferase n=1 Tax=Ahrensia sp. R2A130 TaxID=744979 RepID=UPI0001E0E8E1|nr:DegT/DnrJ/EryC1/StrS family aminotransferase [Ahrensia sp. R2A130]EFL87995.1 DegT/DnrJ/EryC1/StrS aminotransferase [Ahrensia sp. R2A130]
MTIFDKPFTQQEPIDEATIARVGDILRTGRLHRYNTVPGEVSEAAALEAEYAKWQGADYALACASGGYALAVALKAAGLKVGDPVLANAYTLAPVPGAIHNAGGVPVFVEIDEEWHIDIADLEAKAASSGAKFLMLSHMRGHIADMDAVGDICERYGITMVEDCAHTMGAHWRGKRSGNFGHVAAFSLQTYKHINTGEGGLLTTNDPQIAARATIMSGSYMLYGSHGAGPDEAAFDGIRTATPNYSGRMDNLRAAIARGQLVGLDEKVERWNRLYRALDTGLRKSNAITTPVRRDHEHYVGSSLQFRPALDASQFPDFITACAKRGVDVKWFGANKPTAFTSRYDSWEYLGEPQDLPQTRNVLSNTCDIRVPLTFDEADCAVIGSIIVDECSRATGHV